MLGFGSVCSCVGRCGCGGLRLSGLCCLGVFLLVCSFRVRFAHVPSPFLICNQKLSVYHPTSPSGRVGRGRGAAGPPPSTPHTVTPHPPPAPRQRAERRQRVPGTVLGYIYGPAYYRLSQPLVNPGAGAIERLIPNPSLLIVRYIDRLHHRGRLCV